jgi:hypothetical protein
MSKKLIFSFVSVIVIFFTYSLLCLAKGSKTEEERKGSNGIAAGTLEPHLEVEQIGKRDYKVIFTVKNQTERPQTVTFTSGQKYDYILYRDGEKVTQYSEGKFFIQVYQEIILKQAEELRFTETFTNLAKGHYKIEFWLVDRNWPKAKAEAEFTVD